MKRIFTLVVACTLVLSACTTSKDEEAVSDGAPVTESVDDGGVGTPIPRVADDGAPEPEGAGTSGQALDDGQQAEVEVEGGDQAPDGDGVEPEVEQPVPTGPGTLGLFPVVVDESAPGVTDDAVEIGIMYPDLTNVGSIIGIDHGDYEAAYRVAFDQVNNAGGIHGRRIVPVFAPVDPLPADAGTAACTLLTEDEDVFLAVGNFIGDDVLCFVETHETPLLGGNITAEALALARTLWFSTEAGEGFALNGYRSLVQDQRLSGKVGVVAAVGGEEFYETQISPILESGGVEVADVAYLDMALAETDTNALYAAAETIALKFESQNIDQLLFAGGTEPAFFPGLARTGYRPQPIITNYSNADVYISGEGSDLSVLEGAVAFGTFDAELVFRQLGEPTKSCIEEQERRLGITLVPENELEDDDPNYFASSMTACRYTVIAAAILEAAGPELDRGTLITAAHNLGEVMIPGFPDPWYFDKDHPDGIRPLLYYRWDAESESLVAE